MLYYMHNYDCDVCITHAFLDVNRLAKRLRDRENERAPDTQSILPPMPITKTSSKFPKYRNADKYISRSFPWAERESLQSRYLNSHEYVQFHNALSADMVYPVYQSSKHDDRVRVNVYPVTYCGDFKHRLDEIVFEPLYHVTYLHDEKKDDEHVALKNVLTDEGILKDEWNGKFLEDSVRQKLRQILQASDILVTFAYKPSVTKKRKKIQKMKKVKQRNDAILNSSERRKKIKRKRVIADSDTESD